MSIILNPDQEKVVEEAIKFLRNDHQQIFEFSGYAGVGKTICLHEIIRRPEDLPDPKSKQGLLHCR